jgi:hypothetical protein
MEAVTVWRVVLMSEMNGIETSEKAATLSLYADGKVT